MGGGHRAEDAGWRGAPGAGEGPGKLEIGCEVLGRAARNRAASKREAAEEGSGNAGAVRASFPRRLRAGQSPKAERCEWDAVHPAQASAAHVRSEAIGPNRR